MRDWRLLSVIGVCVTTLEVTAMIKGIDGMMFATVIAVLAALGGVAIGKLTIKK